MKQSDLKIAKELNESLSATLPLIYCRVIGSKTRGAKRGVSRKRKYVLQAF